MKLLHRHHTTRGDVDHAAHGTVEFDTDGKVTKIELPTGSWKQDSAGANRYYTQRGNSLLHATELLKAVPAIPDRTYYQVETPDGMLGRDKFGFYTTRPLATSGLTLEVASPSTEDVESQSLTLFGDDMVGSQTSVALLKSQGEYAKFVLLLECGHCGYKSPVETEAGPMQRQCYCCGGTNKTSRATITCYVPSGAIEI